MVGFGMSPPFRQAIEPRDLRPASRPLKLRTMLPLVPIAAVATSFRTYEPEQR